MQVKTLGLVSLARNKKVSSTYTFSDKMRLVYSTHLLFCCAAALLDVRAPVLVSLRSPTSAVLSVGVLSHRLLVLFRGPRAIRVP